MPIRPLPPLLVNQIAAGEVIERPASVVKELIENALDANATRIDVLVEEGGKQLIRISDDGCGIDESELAMALAPHATSKLSAPEQLEAIATLGFRGEALASIASVARLRLTSRPKDKESGSVIEASGETVSNTAPAAAAPGTVIEIRDLFFNTPARRKFMRAAGTEFGHINEIVSRVAMVNPEVAFTLRHGQRKVLDLPPHTQRRRCVAILGNELEEALLEFQQQDERAAIWGLAGLPTIARATAKFQYVCLNGRPIRDRNLAHAIKEAYRGLTPPDRQPMVVILINMDPAAVDVNVHPTKSEVRFRDAGKLHSMLLHALRQRLLESDLTPTAEIGTRAWGLGSGRQEGAAFSSSSSPDPSPQSRDPSAFVDYFKTMAPAQKGFVYEQVKAAMDDAEPTLADAADTSGAGAGGETRSAWDQAGDNQARPPQVLQDAGILQVHRSYLVTQDDTGIIIIDQHALHERVMFEELRRRVLGKTLESQRLLMPAIVAGSSRRQSLLEDLKPLLEQIGIEAQPIGPDTIGVHAFPTLLFEKKVDPAEFLAELLDRAEEGEFDLTSPTATEAALHEVLDMMACKAAVKAGDHLTPEELADLLGQRHEIERASNCPHGRPTTIRLTLRDLERQFGRT